MTAKINGKAWIFGDDIDTDVIIPARYLVTSDEKELGEHCMEDSDADFVKKISAGDLIVGGENFGCGSSREHAPIAIKGAGLSCVIAKSFARIFFRNCINVGLPIFTCPEAVDAISAGDEIEADPEKGVIINRTTGATWTVPPFSPFLQGLISAGGLVSYVRERLNREE